jgi:hypothetical protein
MLPMKLACSLHHCLRLYLRRRISVCTTQASKRKIGSKIQLFSFFSVAPFDATHRVPLSLVGTLQQPTSDDLQREDIRHLRSLCSQRGSFLTRENVEGCPALSKATISFLLAAAVASPSWVLFWECAMCTTTSTRVHTLSLRIIVVAIVARRMRSRDRRSRD